MNLLWAAAILVVSSSCVTSDEPVANRPSEPSPVAADCALQDVAVSLLRFFEEIQEAGPSIEKLFAEEPEFAWFSLSPQRSLRKEVPHVSIHDRDKLGPYFERRSRADQRLIPTEAVIKIDNHRRASAAISLSGTFGASDVATRGLYFGGKTEIHCASGAIEVMSLAVGTDELPATCSSDAEVLKGMRYCEPRRG